MSAAEPADPTPTVVNKNGAAAVIDITTRTVTRTVAAARGRWQAVNHSTEGPPGPRPVHPVAAPGPEASASPERQPLQRSSEEQFADDIEATFNRIGRTLTDDDTEAVYQQTLDIAIHVLRGAHAQGLITEEQRQALTELYEGLKQAPANL